MSRGEFEPSEVFLRRRVVYEEEKIQLLRKKMGSLQIVVDRWKRLSAALDETYSKLDGQGITIPLSRNDIEIYVDRYCPDNEAVGYMVKMPEYIALGGPVWIPFVSKLPLEYAEAAIATIRLGEYDIEGDVAFYVRKASDCLTRPTWLREKRNDQPWRERDDKREHELLKQLINRKCNEELWSDTRGFRFDFALDRVDLVISNRSRMMSLFPATEEEFARYITKNLFTSWVRSRAFPRQLKREEGRRLDFRYAECSPERYVTRSYSEKSSGISLSGSAFLGPRILDDRAVGSAPVFMNLDEEAQYKGYADYADYQEACWNGETGEDPDY